MNLKLKRTPAIYLVGFMGSGKTTVGRSLAETLGWRFVDIDDDIEARAGLPIPRIFEEQGEPEFRRIESESLEARVRAAERGQAMVVALGGGAFVQARNAALIAPHGVSVWLDCPFDQVKARVERQGNRPLARDPEAFERLYHARRPVYAKADFRVTVDGDDPRPAVREILALTGLHPA